MPKRSSNRRPPKPITTDRRAPARTAYLIEEDSPRSKRASSSTAIVRASPKPVAAATVVATDTPEAPPPLAGARIAVTDHGVLHVSVQQQPAAAPASWSMFGVSAAPPIQQLLFWLAQQRPPLGDEGLERGRDLAVSFLQALSRHEGQGALDLPLSEADASRWAAAFRTALPNGRAVTSASVRRVWDSLVDHTRQSLGGSTEGAGAWLAEWFPMLWDDAPRLVLSLVEDRMHDEDLPFVLVGTYFAGGIERPIAAGLAREALGPVRARIEDTLAFTREACPALAAHFDELVDEQPRLTAQDAYEVVTSVDALREAGWEFEVPDWWRRAPRLQATLKIDARRASAIGIEGQLDFQLEAALGGESISKRELDEIIASEAPLMLRRGRLIRIDRPQITQLLDALRTARTNGASVRDLLARGLSRPKDHGPDDDLDLAESAARVELGPQLTQLVRELSSGRGNAADPGKLGPATLQAHQREGVRWLFLRAVLGIGGLLADEMGLGKTIQTIGLLVARRRWFESRDEALGPSLVVAPAGLLATWTQELAKFAPHLRVLVVHGSGDPAATRRRPTQVDSNFDVIVSTSHHVQNTTWIGNQRWDLVVVDEAHDIRNDRTDAHRAVRRLSAHAKFGLTGTPVGISVASFGNLLRIFVPGAVDEDLLAAADGPTSPDRLDAVSRLAEAVRPHMLRRTTELLRDQKLLGRIHHHEILCPMTRRQAALYQGQVNALATALPRTAPQQRFCLVSNSLLRLRQITCHPSLTLKQPAIDEAGSGKVQALVALVRRIRAKGEKLIVFTQFAELVPGLARVLTRLFGEPCPTMTGAMGVPARRRFVADFQRDDGPPFVIMTTGVGGCGLTLTQANHVVHFDRPWNPAVELQAEGRAYRIGQRKEVHVHTLVAQGTVDERIRDLLTRRAHLAAQVLDTPLDRPITQLSNKELLEIVQLRAG